MLWCHPYRFVSSPFLSPFLISRVDLKPENVLICIDNVESIIQAELAQSPSTSTANPANSNPNNPNPNPPTTKLVGVPPSKGRGGNQTPRSESVYITGSQPLPSPSSSFGTGTSPMLDKWAFGMSKIDGEGRESGSRSPMAVNDVSKTVVDKEKEGE